MTSHDTDTRIAGAIGRAGGALPIAAACGFALFFVIGILVTPTLASSALPLPNAPADEARTWFVENQLAAIMTGVLQVLSGAWLAVFVTRVKRIACTPEQMVAVSRATPWGLVAVALVVLSSVFAWVLVALAPTASVETVAMLRTANFISGGTGHVVTLGVFALLASRIPGMTQLVRVLAYVAAVPAVLSLSPLIAFQGASFVLVGRLLCMIWIIAAAVSVVRRIGKGTWA